MSKDYHYRKKTSNKDIDDDLSYHDNDNDDDISLDDEDVAFIRGLDHLPPSRNPGIRPRQTRVSRPEPKERNLATGSAINPNKPIGGGLPPSIAALRNKKKKSAASNASSTSSRIASGGIIGMTSAQPLTSNRSLTHGVSFNMNLPVHNTNNSDSLDADTELTAAEIYGDGVGLGADPGRGRNPRKNNPHRQRSSGDDSGQFLEKEAVLANLGENVDSMAAAASVVTYGTYNLQSKKVKDGDHVLVSIAILDAAAGIDRGEGNLSSRPPKTKAPVNKFGFPQGQGNTEDEKKGPHVYVLCKVRAVHFTGNAREYTVKRFDTEMEQRADRGVMEWIEKGCPGHEAAMAAAKHTPSPPGESGHGSAGFFDNKCFHAISKFCKTGLSATKGFLKDHATRCLSGQAPYRIEIKITTVNLLVICAIIVAFLEQIKHIFEGSSNGDRVMSYTVLAATIVLGLELIVEVYNRPENFSELLKHENAYSPSTVRYINRFHLVFESIALAGVIVELLPLFLGPHDESLNIFVWGAIKATCGESFGMMVAGHAYFILVRLRLFNLVRHVRNYWIKSYESDNSSAPHEGESDDSSSSKEDATLRKAGTIGTALMQVNSERAMILLLVITTAVPIFTAISNGGTNGTIHSMTHYLHNINTVIIGKEPDATNCTVGSVAVQSWFQAENLIWEQSRFPKYHLPKVVLARLADVSNSDQEFRCEGDGKGEVANTLCNESYEALREDCTGWADKDIFQLEKDLGLRHGYLVNIIMEEDGIKTEVVYNYSEAIARTAFNSFMLQLIMLGMAILTIGLLRSHANKLVITPLRRMLKIVLQYAENPLDELDVKMDQVGASDKLGSYETEQLNTAVRKITDLLRTCWGVAGAGIISANLARNMNGKNKMVFNPTVPGKNVYAIFGFAGINDFSNLLRALDKDVMDLINDVAQVVHNEVFRWGSADKGQCNKNLGSCFLMVYRIGDFDEVEEKMRKYKSEIFDRTESREAPIHLPQLPGIAAFADRALLGFLKTFAGINREECVKDWENNFSLTNGVGKHPIQMSFGLDAAWAREGAVGSIYKIDATYLSPHVNMASRMMCACKQFNLTILMSQAVEELLSLEARECVRHVDTVFVKGSKLKQRIFTYDARHQGVDFFLHKRTDSDADKEAENYASTIWNKDPDLLEMRSHISPNFRSTFQRGLDHYLMGNFAEAARTLKEADWLMIETVVDNGRQENINAIGSQLLDRNINHIEVMHLRKKLGDGPSQAIIEYIESQEYQAPANWDGVRQLEKK